MNVKLKIYSIDEHKSALHIITPTTSVSNKPERHRETCPLGFIKTQNEVENGVSSFMFKYVMREE